MPTLTGHKRETICLRRPEESPLFFTSLIKIQLYYSTRSLSALQSLRCNITLSVSQKHDLFFFHFSVCVCVYVKLKCVIFEYTNTTLLHEF